MRKQETNSAKLANMFRQEFQLCNVQPAETICVVSDLESRPDYVRAAFAAADDCGADIYQMCVNSVPSWHRVGSPTVGKCKGTLEAVKCADLILCLHIPLWTKWLKEARDAGARVLMVIDAPDDLYNLMAPPGLRAACIHAGKRLEHAKSLRVISESGTDLSCKLGEYPVMVQYGFAETKGRFDHWGGGHVHTVPNEGTASGTVVIAPGDIVVLPYNRYVQNEIRLEIREGFITKIEGGLDAKLMKNWFDDNRRSADDRDGYAVSHLGWGLNPQGRWDAIALHGDDPERTHAAARVFAGNFLFSTGPNTLGGGKRNTLAHYDVTMRDCTVMLDNDVVIDRGRFADETMIVQRVAR